MPDTDKAKIAVLMACHNRRELTLASLRALLKQRVPSDASLNFFVVDDGSTDGTAGAVRELIPHVHLIQGDGTLYWSRSMRIAMKAAHQSGACFFLCVNDDTVLYQDAVSQLLDVVGKLGMTEKESVWKLPAIVAGATIDPDTQILTYGGLVRCSRWHPLRFKKIEPNGEIQHCDTVNMNVTLLTRGLLDAIGFLSRNFRQGGGDFDLGLRASRRGYPVVMTPRYVGECRANPMIQEARRPPARRPKSLGVWRRFKKLLSVKYQPPRERLVYYRRHAAWIWPILWIAPYLTFWLKEASRVRHVWNHTR